MQKPTGTTGVQSGQSLGSSVASRKGAIKFDRYRIRLERLVQAASAADILFIRTAYLSEVAPSPARSCMSVPATSAGGGFDAAALPQRVQDAVWRGCDLGNAEFRTVPSGFAALDSQLPGKGWPTHSLTEVLTPQAALCEWRLLGPALAAMTCDGGRIYLIAPPKTPCVAGLAQLGLEPKQIVWIEANTPVDRLWTTEQIVKSDPAGAVLSWLPQARPEQIRRLQVHAAACDAPTFLFRPATALRDSSAAPLRVAVTTGPGWDLEVRIPKRRGAALDEVLHLPAMPSNLNGVIPPRLRTLPQLDTISSISKASDARTVGGPSSSAPVARHVAH